LLRFEPRTGHDGPHFACTCARGRVAGMIRGLGQAEAESILAERGDIEVGCDFCGRQYRFDAVDAAQLFLPQGEPMPANPTIQ
jgi:molecular chaperone Hsp33